MHSLPATVAAWGLVGHLYTHPAIKLRFQLLHVRMFVPMTHTVKDIGTARLEVTALLRSPITPLVPLVIPVGILVLLGALLMETANRPHTILPVLPRMVSQK